VMARSAWTKEGLNSGDAARPSSAMAAMAMAVVPDGAGLDKCARGMNGGEADMLARSARLGTERSSGHDSGTSSSSSSTRPWWRPRSVAARRGARVSEIEGERGEEELGHPLLRRLGRWDARQQPSAMVGVRPVHGCHGDNVTNTWCAPLCPCWRPRLGWLWIESRNGPKSKVIPLLMPIFSIKGPKSLEQPISG
jgi:hypothetical protein